MSFPNYPSGPFTPEYCVGGFGGSQFATCGWVTNLKALVVQKLQVWWDSSQITAIQVTYADGSISPLFGSTSETTASISLAPGERVTSFVLWGDGKGSRTGRVRVTTSQGQTFDVGETTYGQASYNAPIGSGILVGMVGRCGGSVDMLGAVFLNGSITSVAIDSVQYHNNLSGKSTQLSQVTLSQAHYLGAPVHGTDWTFSNTVNRNETASFSQISSTIFGPSVGAKVTAEGFEIGGSVQTGFQWRATDSTESGTFTSKEFNLTWGASGHLNPGEGVTCTSLSKMGVGSAQYTSRVTVTLSDGTVSSYYENGVFNNVVYTKAWVTQAPDVDGWPRVLVEGPRASANRCGCGEMVDASQIETSK